MERRTRREGARLLERAATSGSTQAPCGRALGTRLSPCPCLCSCLCPCPPCSTHPSDRGHQMMAEALAGPLRRAVAEEAAAAAGALARSHRDAGFEGLPPPMIPGNTDNPTSLCAMQVPWGRAAGVAWAQSDC